MITEFDIKYLFEDLWPMMIYAQNHKSNCLNNISQIEKYYKKDKNDHNQLLQNLCTINGIGVVIGTGLIWSVFRNERVPFDKYTLYYALDKRIIIDNFIRINYVKYSDKIVKYCEKEEITIEGFVCKALNELQDKSIVLIEPV